MTAKDQMKFWALAVAGFSGFLYLFQAVLLPFVLGGAIAYLLNPAVQKLQRLKISRNWAVVLILLVFAVIVAVFMGFAAPILYRELGEVAQNIPQYIQTLSAKLQTLFDDAQGWLGEQGEFNDFDVQAILGSYAGSAADFAKTIAQKIFLSSMAFFDFLALLVITPVMAYFMMQEWPVITKFVDDLLPRQHRTTIVNLFKEIDKKLSSFIRGQISVVMILAVLYAVALLVAGLKYGFLIGLCAGLLSIIPMLGSILGLLVAVAVAWFQTGEITYMAMIAGIFVAGQFIEGYLLTPKLVGESVGLHPLWVFFAIMAGGSLLGIVGMLIAIPVAAIISVLVAFGLHHYKKSAYYKAKPKPKPKKKTAKNAK